MAKIFPNQLSNEILDDRLRKSEVLLFDKFKDSLLPENTHIYYSVEFLNRFKNKNPAWDGECDFIITDEVNGIIFIEVKGGDIEKKGNIWFQNGRQLKKSPLYQSKQASYQIMKHYDHEWNKKYPNEDRPQFNYGYFAFFPDSHKEKNGDYLSLSEDIEQIGFYEDIEKIDRKVLDFFHYNPAGYVGKKSDLGKKSQEIFHQLFMGNTSLNFSRSLSKQMEINEFKIDQFSEMQMALIDRVKLNKRIYFTGPAGSGKTTMAMYFHNEVYSDNKNRVLLCKNKFLRDHLRKNNIKGGQIETFDSFINQLVNKSPPSKEKNDVFSLLKIQKWNNKIRLKFIDLAYDYIEKNEIKYDSIVIDEAQDFEEDWWVLIEALLSENSNLMIFGDMNQKLWKSGEKPRISGLFDIRLSEIYRNCNKIAERTRMFCDRQGQDLLLKGPSSGGFLLPEIQSIDKALKRILNRLVFSQDLNQSHITIITNNRKTIDKVKNFHFSGISFTENLNDEDDNIFVTSVYKYKGLENHVVIVIMDDEENSFSDEELYTAMSRAISDLYILTKTNRSELLKRLEIFEDQ